MYIDDFCFDGVLGSTKDLTICQFDSNGGVSVCEEGCSIVFDSVTTNGERFDITSSVYSEPLKTTFQVCRYDTTICDAVEISQTKYNEDLMWLQKRTCKMLNFVLLDISDEDDGFGTTYYESVINVKPIKVNGKIYGYELSVITRRPYGLSASKTETLWDFDDSYDIALEDDLEFTYGDFTTIATVKPMLNITVEVSGDLDVSMFYGDNLISNLTVDNCIADEVITIDCDNKIIMSNNDVHTTLPDDFNYVFPKLEDSNGSDILFVNNGIACSCTATYRMPRRSLVVS